MSTKFILLKANIRAKAVNALGVLSQESTASYFTVADVAHHMISQAKIAVDKKETSELRQLINVSLSKCYNSRQDNVFRTTRKISSKYAQNSKASLGYRVGAPITAPVVNEDTIREIKDTTKLLEDKKAMAVLVEQHIAGLSHKELSDLLINIMARQQNLFYKEQEQVRELTYRLDDEKQFNKNK